jgi:hypothetical protein
VRISKTFQGFSEPGGVLTVFAWPLTIFHERPKTFEEFIFALFGKCGPIIAIGRPGESVPPLGASRLWVDDDKWKLVVDELLTEAQYVIMIMGELPMPRQPEQEDGLIWEVRKIFDLEDLQKVILVVPPID